MISRRGFFGVAAAGAALVASPELAELLTPKRTIFLPPKGGWKSSILTIRMIQEEAMRVLSQNMEFTALINRQYDPVLLQVSNDGGKTFRALDESQSGRVIIRRQPRYDLRVGDRITIDGVFALQSPLTSKT